MQNLSNTQYFRVEKETPTSVKEILRIVYEALVKRDTIRVKPDRRLYYVRDPTFITSHKNARSLIMKVERDELVEELLKEYIAGKAWEH